MRSLTYAAAVALVALSSPAWADGVFQGTEGVYHATCCIVGAAGESELGAGGVGNSVAGAAAHGFVSAANLGEAHSAVTFAHTVGGFSQGIAGWQGLSGLQGLAISN
jgi:hypothetical protein